MCVMIDLQFATLWITPSRIHDPHKVTVVMDHAVPAPTLKDAAAGPKARKFVEDFGIENFFDVGRHGICHQVIAKNAPGRSRRKADQAHDHRRRRERPIQIPSAISACCCATAPPPTRQAL
jgi:hypothetical protein